MTHIFDGVDRTVQEIFIVVTIGEPGIVEAFTDRYKAELVAERLNANDNYNNHRFSVVARRLLT